MIFDKRTMQMAKELAREIVRVNREQEIEIQRLKKEKQARATRETFESFGRAIRNLQDAYIEGFVKPLNNAMKAMSRGLNG